MPSFQPEFPCSSRFSKTEVRERGDIFSQQLYACSLFNWPAAFWKYGFLYWWFQYMFQHNYMCFGCCYHSKIISANIWWMGVWEFPWKQSLFMCWLSVCTRIFIHGDENVHTHISSKYDVFCVPLLPKLCKIMHLDPNNLFISPTHVSFL